VRLGINSVVGNPPEDFSSLIGRFVQAEKDGFESVWLNSGGLGEPMTVLAVAGRETSRIEFRTGIAVTYTRHPFLMAQQALTTNAATGGRFTLGLGPSHRVAMERLGFSYDRAAAHVREYLGVLRPLMEGKTVNFKGEFYSVEAQIHLPWAKPCPVVIAALAPLMLKIAGEQADGTVTWMAGPKTLETHIIPKITQAAAAAGRPRPLIYVGLPVAVVDDAQAAREQAARSFANYGNLPVYRRVLDIEGANPEDVAIVGTENEVERQINAIATAGADEFYGSPFVVGDNYEKSISRTRELLKSLVGKV
jgi:5,10-methylenetetrahydromethanopterin reductase